MFEYIEILRSNDSAVDHVKNLQEDKGVEEQSHVGFLLFGIESKIARPVIRVRSLNSTTVVKSMHLLSEED